MRRWLQSGVTVGALVILVACSRTTASPSDTPATDRKPATAAQPATAAVDTRTNVFKAMSGHIVGKAVYVGLFRRPQ